MKIPATTAARANLNHWKAGQGDRIKAKRPPEIYAACEHMARMCAAVRDPLELTRDELGTAVKRAITQERNKRHPGGLPKTADEWWEQVSAIAEQWGVKTVRSEWESTTKTEAKKEAVAA
jgi:hypothetical protein